MIEAIVLAAGKGTRMKSTHPKVLQPILEVSMLEWVLDALRHAEIAHSYVIVGHKHEEVRAVLPKDATAVYQDAQLGTGHAARCGAEYLSADCSHVLVTCGDTPGISSETLRAMAREHIEQKNTITLLSAKVDEPKGYGRIVRSEDGVSAIVEEKDASPEEKRIQEINVGTYLFEKTFFLEALPKLNNDNAQGEYYLTDLIKLAKDQEKKIGAWLLEDPREGAGVNDRVQLAAMTKYLQQRINHHWLLEGVGIPFPEQTYIGPYVQLAQDVFLEAGVGLYGHTTVEEESFIGQGSRLTDSHIGKACHIKHSILWEAKVGDSCTIGPFAYLRPGTELADRVKIGDFVEVKNSTVGEGSKIPHLSYVGDSSVGSSVNIGCGSITCNYDGKKKHRTIIGDHAFIGSNSNLVAPVTVQAHATIGAGSTVTHDVEEAALYVERAPRKIIPQWRKEK